MTEITQAMQEALARAVGLHQDFPDAPNPHWYSKPDEHGVSILLGVAGELPNLTDLTNLFELVVPELHARDIGICMTDSSYRGMWEYSWSVLHYSGGDDFDGPFHVDAGHALFLACCEVLEVKE